VLPVLHNLHYTSVRAARSCRRECNIRHRSDAKFNSITSRAVIVAAVVAAVVVAVSRQADGDVKLTTVPGTLLIRRADMAVMWPAVAVK
jgi:hypothetical protein